MRPRLYQLPRRPFEELKPFISSLYSTSCKLSSVFLRDFFDILHVLPRHFWYYIVTSISLCLFAALHIYPIARGHMFVFKPGIYLAFIMTDRRLSAASFYSFQPHFETLCNLSPFQNILIYTLSRFRLVC